jgi:hypothetical protein
LQGAGWQKHCWSKARAQLLPRLPIEVIRRRVKRAEEPGLDYKSYASIRAASGHDVVAFLFSTNALRLLKQGAAMPRDRVVKLAGLTRCGRLVAVQHPLRTDEVRAVVAKEGIALDTLVAAPGPSHTRGETRAILLSALKPGKIPKDRVVAIGDTTQEQEWCAAGQLAGYVPAERFFDGQ